MHRPQPIVRKAVVRPVVRVADGAAAAVGVAETIVAAAVGVVTTAVAAVAATTMAARS